ncbi:acyl-CoA dehydrogenase [Streptomyces albus subsp. chlorinus]|uniref:acyl-CoA dehydrogenase n=1 Tax=Streptomyces albus TaxID=1888 RepID=UPI001FAC5D00|nr:acyl-CoA dehydrogenase [Streptomyces albus]
MVDGSIGGIGITREHRELADSVRGWLARAVPAEERRAVLDAPPGRDRPAHWEGLARQGLCGLHLPEEAGGGGGSLLDLAVVLEETGRAALPGPYLPHVLAAGLLHAAGAEGELVRALATGERVGAVALGTGSLTVTHPAPSAVSSATHPAASAASAGSSASSASSATEPGGAPGATPPGATAPGGTADNGTADNAPAGDVLVLDGTAPPVLGGAQADVLLLAARRSAAPGSGTVWVAVDAASLGVRPHESTDPLRPTAEVTAAGVPVPGSRVLALDAGRAGDLARTLLAAEACGVASWALETASAHARTREQFGRPIGQFQAVKHLCAEMLVRVEQARALTWDAARAAGEEETPAPVRALTASLAASAALEAAYGCAKDCVQILGGIGFTWEHDAHLYLRRAVAARQLLGTGTAHRLRAARLAARGVRRELRMRLPEGAEAYRAAAREVLAPLRGKDPAAVRRALAPTGYAAPHLPEPYGLGAGPVQQLAVRREMDEVGVRVGGLGIATWVVPSLIAYGTEEQRARHLPPALSGEVLWCQLFSEPGAGSDLASLRTRAERMEDGRWRVSGQKVWTSAAQWAHWGILLARTDPRAPKHEGLTFFLVDMRNTPGLDIRPLKEITGDSLFNEVWFDDAVLPADAVVGRVNDGWRVARHTLGNERVHMADQVAFSTGLETLFGRLGPGEGAERAVGDTAAAGRTAPAGSTPAADNSAAAGDPRAADNSAADSDSPAAGGPAAVDDTVRERLGALAAEAHALVCIGLRTTLRQVEGLDPGAGASVRKLVQTAHQQKVAELALELLGPHGAVREGAGGRAVHGFLMSRCLTIAGGTTQVQLNVVAERLLGLPRDPEPTGPPPRYTTEEQP